MFVQWLRVAAAGMVVAAAGSFGWASQRTAIAARSSPTDCVKFIRDKTWPDGKHIAEKRVVTKQWVVEDCGKAWKGYRVVRFWYEGNDAGLKEIRMAPESYSIPRARKGQDVIVSYKFRTPDVAGAYTLVYQLELPDQIHRFGEALSMRFITP